MDDVDDYGQVVGFGKFMFESGEFSADRLFEYLDSPSDWRDERREWMVANSVIAGLNA